MKFKGAFGWMMMAGVVVIGIAGPAIFQKAFASRIYPEASVKPHQFPTPGPHVTVTSQQADAYNSEISAAWNALSNTDKAQEIAKGGDHDEDDPFGIDTQKYAYVVQKNGTTLKILNPGFDQPYGYGNCTTPKYYLPKNDGLNANCCSVRPPSGGDDGNGDNHSQNHTGNHGNGSGSDDTHNAHP
jgi:hypothetical protein